MFGILPEDDSYQRTILKRFFIALGSYALWATLSIFFHTAGDNLIPASWIAPLIIGVLLTNLIFYSLQRSGFSERFADPSMSMAQIVVAMMWLLVPIVGNAEVRDLYIIGDVMIMMFGVFALRRGGLIIAASFAFFSYLTVVVVDYHFLPQRFVLDNEIKRLAMLGGMMAWCIFFGNYVGELRRTLRRRNTDLNRALREISVMASHDDLTQAFNRRYIMDALKQEKSRADRSKDPFSVIIMDLDHFKAINDRYGHLAGDHVLMGFSDRIRATLRGMDLVDTFERSSCLGRYGGEEFIVVLPGTTLEGALQCANRLCAVTRDTPFDQVFEITLSAGVACYASGESIEALLQRADRALYQAKDAGRDQVIGLAVNDDTPLPPQSAPGKPDNIVVGRFGAAKPKGTD